MDESLKSNWLSDLNPNSLTVVKDALCDISIVGSTIGTTFQFERVAFFVVDPDSTSSQFVFNRTVSLKESKPKTSNITTNSNDNNEPETRRSNRSIKKSTTDTTTGKSKSTSK